MKYKINKGFINQRIGEKIVIFDVEESVTYTLNPVGSFIFEKLKEGWGREKLSKGLIRKYDITGKQIEKDIDEFIEKLLKMNLLTK